MKLQRPKSVLEVGLATKENVAAFHDLLKDFVLEFSRMDAAQRATALEEEPPLLGGDGVADAYLAATAETLAIREGLDSPGWVGKPERFLRFAWYAGGLESLKPILLVESPAAFRIRNLFVSANALDRPGYCLAMNEVAAA